jgi:2-haloacid dehalogenase
MLDFARFTHLTFDCYGTLIDWENGILRGLRPIIAAHKPTVPANEQLLELYGSIESEIEAGLYRSYREVLAEVVRDFGARLGFAPTISETGALADSLQDWLPFPDTVAALRQLSKRYQLAVVSNIDDDLFAASARRLEVPFAAVVTAQQVGSYKPALNHFRVALERLNVPPAQVLHVAQSLFHDVAPAKSMGLATVWVNRRKGKGGFGATPVAAIQPDLEVPDLKTLAELMH